MKSDKDHICMFAENPLQSFPKPPLHPEKLFGCVGPIMSVLLDDEMLTS